MVEDPDPRVRFQAALSLGNMKPGQFRARALEKIAKVDAADPWVRTAILSSLGDDTWIFLRLFIYSQRDLKHLPKGYEELTQEAAKVIGTRGKGSEMSAILGAFIPSGDVVGLIATLRGLVTGIKLSGSKTPPEVNPIMLSHMRRCARTEDAQVALGEFEKLVAPVTLKLNQILSELKPQDDPVKQENRIGLLNYVDDPGVTEALLEKWGGFDPRVREKALEVIFSRKNRISVFLDALEAGKFQVSKVPAGRRAELLKFPDAVIAERAQKIFANAEAADDPALYEKYKPALELTGVPAKGAEIHKQRCASCHRVGEVGFDVGPNWSAIQSNAPDQILTNILYPNRAIQAGFTNYVIELEGGRVAMGLIVSSTPTGIVLRRGQGEEETILRRNIKSMSDTTLSIMPEGLFEGLGPQDAADLLAFIQSAYAVNAK